MDIENRFIELEIKMAHLEKNSEDLSVVVYEQQKEIQRLEKKLDDLIKRIQSGTSGELDIRGPNEKPPHY